MMLWCGSGVTDGQVVRVQHCLLAAGSRQQAALAGLMACGW